MPGNCERCGGPTHHLLSTDAPSTRYESHWCTACLEEEWPACRLDGRYGLVWKLVSLDGRPWTRSYRGLMGAPYRVGFPSVLFSPRFGIAGNFLLSPLGALKEFYIRSGVTWEQGMENWALLCVIVPWERVILRPDLVLQGDSVTPHLPLAALGVKVVVRLGLTPQKATSLLDGLPERVAWLEVQAWEEKLRPELPAWWKRRIQAAEGLAQGFALLHPWDVPQLRKLELLHLLHPRRSLKEVRVRNQERLKRFLGALSQQLFSDADREARYRKVRAAERKRKPDYADILWLHPTTGAIEGVFNPWLELEVLLKMLHEEELDIWVGALERAAQALLT